ncbi:MAG: hypothetical protein IPK15_05525 [Verrucomicrobia bacterium]|nr:hypothetical protein [Verrucomicrobiota bacterium]
MYRGEYLAWQLLKTFDSRSSGRESAHSGSATGDQSRLTSAATSEEQRLTLIQEFIDARYHEGYTKGIHDLDGERIFRVLLETHTALQLARYHPTARACALVYWHRFCPAETRTLWSAKLKGFAVRNRLFPGDPAQQDYINTLQALIAAFAEQTKLFPAAVSTAAGEYLFHELITGDAFVISNEADQLVAAFNQQLATKGSEDEFKQARAALADHPASELELVRDWVRGFLFPEQDVSPLSLALRQEIRADSRPLLRATECSSPTRSSLSFSAAMASSDRS